MRLVARRLLVVACGGLACARSTSRRETDSLSTRATTEGVQPVQTTLRDQPAQTVQSGGPIDATDDIGEVVHLARPAQRVISLIPSVTETLIAIGAGPQLVGRTRYDVAPAIAALPSVGGGIDPSVEAIVALHPDLVLTWENMDRQAIRQKLLAVHIPVFVLRTQDTTDIFRGMATLGRLTGHDSTAAAVAESVRAELTAVRRAVAGRHTPTVLYVVYNDPPMTAGPATFIGQLVTLAGGQSIFADAGELWPTVPMESIVQRDPDLLIVPAAESPEKTHERFRTLPGWRDLRAVRTGRIVTVPADLMDRPSPSIGQVARVLASVFHPELHIDTASAAYGNGVTGRDTTLAASRPAGRAR